MIISKMLGLPYPPECSPREYSNLKASFVRDREELRARKPSLSGYTKLCVAPKHLPRHREEKRR